MFTITRRLLYSGLAAIVVGALIAVTLVLALQGPAKSEPETFSIVGSLSVVDCTSAGYSDIDVGTQVEIVDQTNKVLAVGVLNSVDVDTDSPTTFLPLCTFPFTVDAVPAGRDMYGVRVSHRGTVWFDEATAKANVSLTIGSGQAYP